MKLGKAPIQVGDIVSYLKVVCLVVHIEEVWAHHIDKPLKLSHPYVLIDIKTGCKVNAFRTLESLSDFSTLLMFGKDAVIVRGGSDEN